MRIIFATRVMGDKALLVGQLDPTTGKVTDFEETGQMWFGGGNKNSKAQYYRHIDISDGFLDPKKASILQPQENIFYPPI